MPPSLSELQRALSAHILGGADTTVLSWLWVPESADPLERLALHVDGYPARVAESVGEAFPATAHLLGSGSFAELIQRYARQVPADLRNLNRVGAGLPGFLLADRLLDDLPFLYDLARLEWAIVECFHAEVAPVFDLASCEGWALHDWANARMGFQPAMALVSSAWPILELREARHVDREEIDIGLVGRPECTLVYRRGFEVVTESIDAREAAALEGLEEGACLGKVAEALAEAGAGCDSVSRWFARWTSLGLVTACRASA
ncbi:MAG: DNA-binding domain-containing protein [Myxococcota bacterium]